jgi:hypothetical protein
MQVDHVALFDLDSSLADFEGALRAGLNALRGPSEPEIAATTDLHELELQHPYVRARMDLIKAQPGFWSHLKPLEDGFTTRNGENVSYRDRGSEAQRRDRAGIDACVPIEDRCGYRILAG